MKKSQCTEIEKWIIRYANATKKKAGGAPFRTNWGLTRIARNHSSRMAKSKRIWHGDGVKKAGSSLTHKSFWGLIRSVFYRGCSGENVGLMYQGRVKGFKYPLRTPKDIALAQHKSWMRSPGHKANILNRDFSLIGVGVVRNRNGYYSTQIFYG